MRIDTGIAAFMSLCCILFHFAIGLSGLGARRMAQKDIEMSTMSIGQDKSEVLSFCLVLQV